MTDRKRRASRGVAVKWTQPRLDELLAMLKEGNTFQDCADAFGVSKQRISEVIKNYLPEINRAEIGAAKRKRKKEVAKRRVFLDEYGRRSWRYVDKNASELEKAFARSFMRKQANASKMSAQGSWEFSITFSDLHFPTHCPILGIELDWFAEKRQENSPSYDRIDPSKGYIPGNVAIVSWRANRIKNDGTADEHRKISEWLDKINSKT